MDDVGDPAVGSPPLPFVPYPPIERHGVGGDHRTAALVAADGTLAWCCRPDYDGPSRCGALRDAERGGCWRLGAAGTDGRRAELGAIRAEGRDRGRRERLGAARQRDEADALDAAARLIPVTRVLPADQPRVLATAERIAESLAVDGLGHRVLAAETSGHGDLPLGEVEGAFLPRTFWLATTCAMAGRPGEAEAILAKVEPIAGAPGLVAEAVDARSGAFLGNGPLLFAQVEYVRAVLEPAKARPLDRARLTAGMLVRRLGRLLPGIGGPRSGRRHPIEGRS